MFDTLENWKIALLALGSNIGDKEKFIGTAVQEIACMDGIEILASSCLMSTSPVGVENQDYYLNQLLLVRTRQESFELLNSLKTLEKKIGRLDREHWAPREIDIDIVVYEGVIEYTTELKIPHPQFFNRKFLMMGALQIAPDYVVEGTDMTIAEIYNEIKDTFANQHVGFFDLDTQASKAEDQPN